MKLHKDLLRLLEYNDPETVAFFDIVEYRKLFNEMINNMPVRENDGILISNRFIPGPTGEPYVRVRIYEPEEKGELLPGVLWFHGGACVLGYPEMSDNICKRILSETNCVIVSVDYRLAPENPFPAPVEDCYAAL